MPGDDNWEDCFLIDAYVEGISPLMLSMEVGCLLSVGSGADQTFVEIPVTPETNIHRGAGTRAVDKESSQKNSVVCPELLLN